MLSKARSNALYDHAVEQQSDSSAYLRSAGSAVGCVGPDARIGRLQEKAGFLCLPFLLSSSIPISFVITSSHQPRDLLADLHSPNFSFHSKGVPMPERGRGLHGCVSEWLSRVELAKPRPQHLSCFSLAFLLLSLFRL